mgnify:CR=1 FL=1
MEPWTEKYRPRKLDDMVLPPRIYDVLSTSTGNLLLYGGAGQGKTTAAKVCAGEAPTLFINCSLNSSVDDVRGTIFDFCSTASVIDGDERKVVILDEFEGVSDQYFKAMRGVVEQFSGTARFIATTNHFNRIPDAMRSRFECIGFDPTPDERDAMHLSYLRRVNHVIRQEGMTATKEGLMELGRRAFPDVRRSIIILQSMRSSGRTEVTPAAVASAPLPNEELFELACSEPNDPVDNYRKIQRYAGSVEDSIRALGSDFVEWLILKRPTISHRIGPVLYEVNAHSVQSRTAIDPFITLASLVHRLQQTLNKK